MAIDQNSVNVVGRLTADPVLKYTQSGKGVCEFSIANNRTFGEKENVYFFNCVAWGKVAEVVSEHLRKGHQVAVSGNLEQRRWETDEGAKRSIIQIVAREVQFLSRPKGE